MNVDELSHDALPVETGDVHNEMDRQRNGFARAPMRQSHIRQKDAVREPRQRLLCGVRVYRTQTAQVASVQCLQQIECFGTTYLTDQNAIRSMTKRGP